MPDLSSSIPVRFVSASLLALLSLAPCGCIVKPQALELPSQDATPKELVVVGYAEVEGTPDQAKIRIGVQERDKDPEMVMQAVGQKARKMFATLDALGVPKEKVTTDNIVLRERFERGGDRQSFREALMDEEIGDIPKTPPAKHYEGQYMIEVVLDDVSKVGALVQAVQKSGVNRIVSIDFDMKDSVAYTNKAAKLAVENAVVQAKVLAQSAGRKLGEISSVATTWGDEHGGAVIGGVVGGYMHESDGRGMRFPIRPGLMTFERQVRVSFKLEKLDAQ